MAAGIGGDVRGLSLEPSRFFYDSCVKFNSSNDSNS
jgi:hypothetical protein